jgi:hypothetical protein
MAQGGTKRQVGVGLTLLLLSLGAVAGPRSEKPKEAEAPVLMVADDGKAYRVGPGETLGAAMRRESPVLQQTTGENGNCVPEPMENKPEGSVGCKCYEVTECKGGEATQCKRHCKKDLCMCCSV